MRQGLFVSERGCREADGEAGRGEMPCVGEWYDAFFLEPLRILRSSSPLPSPFKLTHIYLSSSCRPTIAQAFGLEEKQEISSSLPYPSRLPRPLHPPPLPQPSLSSRFVRLRGARLNSCTSGLSPEFIHRLPTAILDLIGKPDHSLLFVRLSSRSSSFSFIFLLRPSLSLNLSPFLFSSYKVAQHSRTSAAYFTPSSTATNLLLVHASSLRVVVQLEASLPSPPYPFQQQQPVPRLELVFQLPRKNLSKPLQRFLQHEQSKQLRSERIFSWFFLEARELGSRRGLDGI